MEVWILNETFESLALIEQYNSILWIERYNSPGMFELITVANKEMFDLLKLDYYIWVKDSEMVCIIETQEITTDVEMGFQLKSSGRSLESILDRRIVWNQTRLVSYFQTAIKKLLNENVISPEIPERKIANFIYEDTTDEKVLKKKVNRQFTGDNLLEVIMDTCNESKVGFRIRLRDSDTFVFSLYMGEDRSYAQEENPWVIFSTGFDNIINSTELVSKETYKTMVLVAGEGTGTERRTTTVGSVTSANLYRRELYVDARDIQSEDEDGNPISEDDYISELKLRGEKELNEYIILKAFDGQLETTQMHKYGRDFFLGDIVQIVNPFKVESRVRVTEVTQSFNNAGYQCYPTFVSVDGETAADDTSNAILTDVTTETILEDFSLYWYTVEQHTANENDPPSEWNLYSDIWRSFRIRLNMMTNYETIKVIMYGYQNGGIKHQTDQYGDPIPGKYEMSPRLAPEVTLKSIPVYRRGDPDLELVNIALIIYEGGSAVSTYSANVVNRTYNGQPIKSIVNVDTSSGYPPGISLDDTDRYDVMVENISVLLRLEYREVGK